MNQEAWPIFEPRNLIGVSDFVGKTLDLGKRVEIQPMDTQCHGISLGLYRQEWDECPHYLVHTYSGHEQASGRMEYIRQAMITMLGLHASEHQPEWLRFHCGHSHEKAVRRGFLDLCKLETGAPLQPKPCTAFDKKADCELSIRYQGDGSYVIDAVAETDSSLKRVQALVRGFVKVCEMEAIESPVSAVRFPCGGEHASLLGMLMFRAQNVRAAMAEEANAAGRGSLVPPSQQ